MTKFQPGDRVRHILSGEEWILRRVYECYVEPEGMPETYALASDCTLIARRPDAAMAALHDLNRIAAEQAVEIEDLRIQLRIHLAQVVEALGKALDAYDGADLASAEPAETTAALDYCQSVLELHSKAAKP